jgi:signal peptidase II
VDRALHRGPARAGAGLTDTAPDRPRSPLDVRVGSATDGLTPISVAERSLAARLPQWVELGAIVGAAIGADQLTKHVVASHLALDDGVHVLGPFWIRHVENPGIAFGLFAQATPVVILLTMLAVAWMLGYFARSGARHPVLPVALGLVIDFLDPRFGPAFNLADSFIVVGVAILLVALFGGDREPRRPRRLDGQAARP